MGNENDVKANIEKMLQDHQLVEAYHSIREAVETAPWKKELIFLYAFVSICNGYDKDAVAALNNEAVFGLNEDFILAKAHLLLKEKRVQEAEEHLNRLIEAHKNYYLILKGIAAKLFCLDLFPLGRAYISCVLKNSDISNSSKSHLRRKFSFYLVGTATEDDTIPF